jgi:hypothetical protein
LGGSGNEFAYAIGVDTLDDAYVTGQTTSTDFPTAGTPFQATLRGGNDAYFTKLSPTSSLVYSTYLGGSSSSDESGSGVAVDATGNAYVSGYTSSTDFPTAGTASQPAFGGGPTDAFLVRFRSDRTDFYTVTPCRVADTRNAIGPSGGPALVANSTRIFPVTGGVCGIPSTATAVSVNLTAVQAAAVGYLTLYPGNALSTPLVSSINFSPGHTRANNAVVLLATDGAGTIKVSNGSAGTVHFVLDVNGYFQ